MSVLPDDERPVEQADDLEILPDQTGDDTDRGWGEWQDTRDDDARFLEERPPHW